MTSEGYMATLDCVGRINTFRHISDMANGVG